MCLIEKICAFYRDITSATLSILKGETVPLDVLQIKVRNFMFMSAVVVFLCCGTINRISILKVIFFFHNQDKNISFHLHYVCVTRASKSSRSLLWWDFVGVHSEMWPQQLASKIWFFIFFFIWFDLSRREITQDSTIGHSDYNPGDTVTKFHIQKSNQPFFLIGIGTLDHWRQKQHIGLALFGWGFIKTSDYLIGTVDVMRWDVVSYTVEKSFRSGPL